MNDLRQQREEAAQKKFESSNDIRGIEDFERGWTVDGDIWSRQIYWPGEGDFISGSFGVEFKPGTAEIVSEWSQ
jgi:hypothetical protein